MNTYVISDLHGCSNTFKALLNKIGLTKNDHLYLLGDYIDRGRNSSGVLDIIIDLQKKDYPIFPLRGNHEENILKAEKEYDLATFIHFVKKLNKSGDLLTADGRLIEKYRMFFNSLPYYYLLDDFVLVHAGLNLNIADPFQDINAMIDLRGFTKMDKHPMIGQRKIIHGHVPCEFDQILAHIENKSQIIPLDNGCVYTQKHKVYDYTKHGKLLCLELNQFKLTFQDNID